MATRRPKVPRATPAAPKSPDTGDGGDVIRADFGASRDAPPHAAPSHTAPSHGGKAATAPAAAGKNTPASGTPASGTGASGTAKPSMGHTAAADGHIDPVPAKAFSGRMLALFVVMIAITIMLAPTVKIFFEKRAEIAALEADISAKESQQDDLRRQVSRWQDPNYVKQQARDRINMVMPGETGYWVFGSDLPAGASGGAAGAGSQQDPAELPWVDSLWESIRRSATD
ncbi:cell division protein FtsB [Arthrobacter ginsengisoli]|uniref:Cell division protein FtsB n=1 Tax=Arthrobacter ginsengisoli TaxID=1356565 RepID=A0ABU1U7V1_9MICC|nr:septum formation initiator family protein [Arthrobacter ginsengisoli]MDR7081238.1 cell division protein FtsB [Arthrobacter ginsengisoli]